MFLAYLDPGAGSLLVQVLIAGIIAIPFLVRSQLTRILGRLRARVIRTAPAPPGVGELRD